MCSSNHLCANGTLVFFVHPRRSWRTKWNCDVAKSASKVLCLRQKFDPEAHLSHKMTSAYETGKWRQSHKTSLKRCACHAKDTLFQPDDFVRPLQRFATCQKCKQLLSSKMSMIPGACHISLEPWKVKCEGTCQTHITQARKQLSHHNWWRWRMRSRIIAGSPLVNSWG